MSNVNFSLKHTINVATEYHSPLYGSTRLPKDYCARHFNVERIRQDFDLTEEQLEHLDSLVLIKEGVGDFWTAYAKACYLGVSGKGTGRFDSNNWLNVDETLITCGAGVIAEL